MICNDDSLIDSKNFNFLLSITPLIPIFLSITLTETSYILLFLEKVSRTKLLFFFSINFFNSENLPVRFRPSFFPFTEPSAEVDIGCKKIKDGSLSIGEGEDWLEILGSGMVHPKVLLGVGIDPDLYQGFAFGMGLERLTMLKYGIPDLRPFYDSDLRWLKHYGFLGIEETSLHSGLNGVNS